MGDAPRWARTEMGARGEAGFTLIESLVALAVLATASVALLAATEAHVSRIGGLEDRALAQLAAENRLAEIELGLGAEPVEASLLGRVFRVETAIVETEDPDLLRLDLVVRDAGSGAVVLAGFTGFVDAQAMR